MTGWFGRIKTERWDPAKRRSLLGLPESPARHGLSAATSFRPPPRSDDPPEGNVWTLSNGERLDTPERLFDWLECQFRDHADRLEPGFLDRLVDHRRNTELAANYRLRRSHN